MAVALNCGTGSSFLKALVNALDKLHIVRGREFLVLRFKIQPVDIGQETPGRFQLAVYKGRIEDQFRPLIGDLRLSPVFDLALQGSKLRWILSTPTEECQSD